MLNKMMVGKYYPISSKIHHLNPLSKILCSFIFFLLILINNSLSFAFLITCFVLLIMIMTKIPFKIYFKAIKSIWILVFFLIIINLIFFISWSNTVLIILRLILIVLYTSILTLTTPPTELTYGLECFLSPLRIFKLPVSKIALSLSLGLRFIPIVIDQANKIIKAQTCRGIDYTNSKISDKIIGVRSLILPMIIYSFKKSDELALSMELRLFNLESRRKNFRMNKWKFFDTYMVCVHLTILILLIIKEVLL